MTGGIFPNYPFELNPKCIVFSIIIIGLYFYEPPKMNLVWKLLRSFFIFVIAYVAMAYYDYQFECQKLALKRGTSGYGITGLLKPNTHTESQIDRTKMNDAEKILEWRLINIYHLFILAPLCLYIYTNRNEKINENYFILLILNFIFAILYHIVRFNRDFNIISLIHILVSIAGIYLTLTNNKTELYYNSLLITGLYAGLKHGYHLMLSFH